jgi:hypothetical protein
MFKKISKSLSLVTPVAALCFTLIFPGAQASAEEDTANLNETFSYCRYSLDDFNGVNGKVQLANRKYPRQPVKTDEWFYWGPLYISTHIVCGVKGSSKSYLYLNQTHRYHEILANVSSCRNVVNAIVKNPTAVYDFKIEHSYVTAITLNPTKQCQGLGWVVDKK